MIHQIQIHQLTGAGWGRTWCGRICIELDLKTTDDCTEVTCPWCIEQMAFRVDAYLDKLMLPRPVLK